MTRRTHALALAAALLLAACSALPSKPVQRTLYDLGPLAPASAAAAPSTAALVLPDVEPSGTLDTTALLYRLGYSDSHALRPYAYARWTASPAQLVGQRLRAILGRERPVLDASSAAALSRRGGTTAPPVLRVELEEFSQLFDSTTASRGVLRLRCTLLETTAAGERLIAQRTFEVERPAPTADASGGVRALAEATDAAADQIGSWLRQR